MLKFFLPPVKLGVISTHKCTNKKEVLYKEPPE